MRTRQPCASTTNLDPETLSGARAPGSRARTRRATGAGRPTAACPASARRESAACSCPPCNPETLTLTLKPLSPQNPMAQEAQCKCAHQEAVREHGARQGQAGREQHARPVHGVEAQDVLSHQVHVRGPVPRRQLRAVRRRALWQQRCAHSDAVSAGHATILAAYLQSPPWFAPLMPFLLFILCH